MTDRNVQYPYRFHVRPVPGTDDICEIIPAPGTVYEDGTFWAKANVLKDATAALYGKGPAAVPDEIFAAIRPLITDAKNAARVTTGTYTGTYSLGGNLAQKIYLPFHPKFFCCINSKEDFDSATNGISCIIGIGIGRKVGYVAEYGSSYAQGNIWDGIDGSVVTVKAMINWTGEQYNYFAVG